jgi:hypothetical protein
VAQRAFLERAPGFAQGFPIGQFIDHGLALAADGLGSLAHVAPQLGIRQRHARALLKG